MNDLKKQPIFEIPTSPLERVFTIGSLFLLIFNALYIMVEWSSLPNKIPGHYNAAGEVDRWGQKWELWLPMGIGLFIWLGMTILERYPHIYNYLNLTEQNAERQYILARKLLNTLKLEIVALFVLLNVRSIQIAHGEISGLGEWYLPVFLGVIFGTLGFYLFRSLTLK